MPTERLFLVGVHNQRTIDGQAALVLNEDQQFMNCLFDVVKNPVTGKSTFYLSKRPGFSIQSLVSAGNISTGLIRTDILGTTVSAFGTPNSTIFDTQTNVGTITGEAIHFWETSLPGTTSATGYVMIRSSDGTGWYYASDSKNQLTYTGTTTATNVQMDGVASTAGIYSGQLLTSANLTAGTRVSTVMTTTQITVTPAASGTGAAAFTKEPIAKILSVNFVTTGTNKSSFVDLDGYITYCAEDGYLYNSDLNSVSAFTASNKIAVNSSADLPVAIAKQDEKIVVFGTGSTQLFNNAGNPTGSIFNNYGNPKLTGIQNQRSLVPLEDDLYFVASSRTGDASVKKMSHLQIAEISTPAIERIIGTSNATGSAFYASAFTLGGYSYLLLQVLSIISVTTTNFFLQMEDGNYLLLETGDKFILEADTNSVTALTRELVYNIDLNIWSEWDCPLATFVKGTGYASTNQIIASSRLSTSGKIYAINPAAETEVYTDDGTTITTSVRTSKVDYGTDKKKYVSRIDLIGDVQSAGTALLESSDDDYQTWKTLGTFDLTQKTQRITRCGSYAGGRAYRLTHSANAAFRAQALDITYSVGLN